MVPVMPVTSGRRFAVLTTGELWRRTSSAHVLPYVAVVEEIMIAVCLVGVETHVVVTVPG
jgi:hypothetical protein